MSSIQLSQNKLQKTAVALFQKKKPQHLHAAVMRALEKAKHKGDPAASQPLRRQDTKTQKLKDMFSRGLKSRMSTVMEAADQKEKPKAPLSLAEQLILQSQKLKPVNKDPEMKLGSTLQEQLNA